MEDVIDFIHTNRDRYVGELKQYLAIPSIRALPEHAEDVKRCAQWTADELGRVGLENVRLIENGWKSGRLRRLVACGWGRCPHHPVLRPL